MVTKVFDGDGKFEGHVITDDEFATLNADQLREMVATFYEDQKSVVRRPDGSYLLVTHDDWYVLEDEDEEAAA